MWLWSALLAYVDGLSTFALVGLYVIACVAITVGSLAIGDWWERRCDRRAARQHPAPLAGMARPVDRAELRLRIRRDVAERRHQAGTRRVYSHEPIQAPGRLDGEASGYQTTRLTQHPRDAA